MAKTMQIGAKFSMNSTAFVASMQRATKSMGAFTMSTKGLTAGLMGVSSVMGAGLGIKAMISDTVEFEHKMTRVNAILGATAEESVRVESAIRSMTKTTQFGAMESAGAMEFLAMAGLSASESMLALKSTLQLATIGNMDLARAADIATNIMTGFGQGAEDLGRTNDILATAVTSANTNIEQLGRAFRFAAPVARGLGEEILSVTKAFGLMANAGIRGSEAGTAYAQSISRLVRAPKAVQDTLSDLGLVIDETTISTAGFVGTMQMVGKSGADMAQIAKLLGRHWKTLLPLVQATPEELRKVNEEMDNFAGNAGRLAVDGFGKTKLAIAQTVNELQELGIQMGESGVLDAVGGMANGLKALIEMIEEVVDSTSGLALIFGVVGASMATGPLKNYIMSLIKVKAAESSMIRLGAAKTAASKAYNATMAERVVLMKTETAGSAKLLANEKALTIQRAQLNTAQRTYNNTAAVAATSTKTFSSALRGLAASMGAVMMSMGIALAIGVAIAAITKLVGNIQDARREMTILADTAAEASAKGIVDTNKLDDSIDKLKELGESMQGVSKLSGEYRDMQKELSTELGKVNTDYGTYLDSMLTEEDYLDRLVTLREKAAGGIMQSAIETSFSDLIAERAKANVEAIKALQEYEDESGNEGLTKNIRRIIKENKKGAEQYLKAMSMSVAAQADLPMKEMRSMVKELNALTDGDIRKKIKVQTLIGAMVKAEGKLQATYVERDRLVANYSVTQKSTSKEILTQLAAYKDVNGTAEELRKKLKEVTDLTAKASGTGFDEPYKEGSRLVSAYTAKLREVSSVESLRLQELKERRSVLKGTLAAEGGVLLPDANKIKVANIELKAVNKEIKELQGLGTGKSSNTKRTFKETIEYIKKKYLEANAVIDMEELMGNDVTAKRAKTRVTELKEMSTARARYNKSIDEGEVAEAAALIQLGKKLKIEAKIADSRAASSAKIEGLKLEATITGKPTDIEQAKTGMSEAISELYSYGKEITEKEREELVLRYAAFKVDLSEANFEKAAKEIQNTFKAALKSNAAKDSGSGADSLSRAVLDAKALVARLKADIKNALGNEKLTIKLQVELDTAEAELKSAERVVAWSNTVKGAVVTAMADTAALIGKTMDNAFAGGSSSMEHFFDGMMGIIGSGLQTVGKALVVYGMAMASFKEAFKNPYAAIAAGVVLIAAGAMLSSAASRSFSSTGGSSDTKTPGAPSASRASSVAMITDPEYNAATGGASGVSTGDSKTVKVEGEFKLKGTDLVATIDKTNKKSNKY